MDEFDPTKQYGRYVTLFGWYAPDELVLEAKQELQKFFEGFIPQAALQLGGFSWEIVPEAVDTDPETGERFTSTIVICRWTPHRRTG